jgi:hypothetical protein
MYIWSVIGILLVLWITIRFFKEIGKSLPVIELMLLIAGLQWVLGAFNSYRLSVEHFKYYMRVDEVTFMSYVVPAFLGFTTVLLIRVKKYKITLRFNPVQYIKYGRYLLFIGVGADVLKFISPSSLLFFIFLVSLFKFVGAGILLFSKNIEDRLFFYGSLMYLFVHALGSAMFHDFILWGVFLFLIWALKNKPSVKTKLMLMMCGLGIVLGIQMVKSSFREVVWGGYDDNKLELFINIFERTMSDSYFSDEENLNELNVRLNQGWHISCIMNHVPTSEAYANGATVLEALEATLLPRILSKNKKKAGGRENFIKYTGLLLADNTSMGLSVVGESYANFGVFGGILFMIIWGWFLSTFWIKLVKICKRHPLLVFFIPMMFLQVVKAETELMVVLNHLVKASIVVWLFFWFSKKYLNWKI